MKVSLKTIKILTAALLLTALLFGSFGCVRHTHIVMESRRIGDFFCSVYEDGTVDITAWSGTDEELRIPSKLDGLSVVGFGMKTFDSFEHLKAVYIPGTVTSLPAKLFNACPNLEKIYIPASVNSIGQNVIFNCPNLNTVLYGGTQAQWDEIYVGAVPWTDNYDLINSEIVYEYKMQ